MSTIEKFLESPSSTFEDVTDVVLSRGGPKYEDDVAAVSDGASDVAQPAEVDKDVETQVVTPVDVPLVADVEPVGDSAAVDLPEPVETSIETQVQASAVESPADEDDEPEPPRRRRRR
jgi:hypothetical protein